MHRQIGCAGYRLDLAIVDGAHPGRYSLGIECDGATYHSSKTARDRDRLRQQILEDMGWRGRILRIWSSDWIQNRTSQVERVLQALTPAKDIGYVGTPFLEPEEPVAEANTAFPSPEEDIEADRDGISPTLMDVEGDQILTEGVTAFQAYEGKLLGEPTDFYTLASIPYPLMSLQVRLRKPGFKTLI